MSVVLLVFGVPARLLTPSDATVAAVVVEVCAASPERGLARVSTAMDTTACSRLVADRAADEGSILLSFISSDRGLLRDGRVPVRIDLATRSVSLVADARPENVRAPARWVAVVVEVPADVLPPGPFMIHDEAGDTVVVAGQPS